MEKSFLNQEDLALSAKIKTEMPGIFWWALEGWERLETRGHFVQPPAGAELLEEFEQLNNPIGAFVAECCNLNPEAEEKVKDLYASWQSWCQKSGREHPGDLQGFSKNLKACLGSVKTKDRMEKRVRYRVFTGIQLDPENPDTF